MEKTNKCIETNENILEYLKKVNVESSSVHEEFKISHYILSVVMVMIKDNTLKSTSDEYLIYFLIQDKIDNTVYGNFSSKKFFVKDMADNYYNKLKTLVKTLTTSDILGLLNEIHRNTSK